MDGVSSCPYAEDFNCVEDVGEHQLCILRDPLTCNLLPNCAQRVRLSVVDLFGCEKADKVALSEQCDLVLQLVLQNPSSNV